MNNVRFYRCMVCGNFVTLINSGSVPFICCNKQMVEQIPTKINKVLKYEIKNNQIIFNSKEIAQMAKQDKYINFIYLQTSIRGIRKDLKLLDDEKIIFDLMQQESPIRLYVYNINDGLVYYEINKMEVININNDQWFHPKSSYNYDLAKKIAQEIGIDFKTAEFTLEDFYWGMCIELEHGYTQNLTNVTNDDPKVTGKIALAHLNENPLYYDMNVGIMAWQNALIKISKNKIDPKTKKLKIE